MFNGLFAARVRDKWFVVVDGEKGHEFDGFIGATYGGGIQFDGSDDLHYLTETHGPGWIAIDLVEQTLH